KSSVPAARSIISTSRRIWRKGRCISSAPLAAWTLPSTSPPWFIVSSPSLESQFQPNPCRLNSRILLHHRPIMPLAQQFPPRGRCLLLPSLQPHRLPLRLAVFVSTWLLRRNPPPKHNRLKPVNFHAASSTAANWR